MAYRWSETQNRLLIQLVKDRPCLWNKLDPERSNKQAKDSSWEEIDAMLGTTGANRRFKSLRDDYTRWTKGTRKEYNYAEDMSFLKDEIGHRNGAIAKRKDRLVADTSTTIELLDESDESQGLYDEEHLHQQQQQSHSLHMNASHLFGQPLAAYFQTPTAELEPAQTTSNAMPVIASTSSNHRSRQSKRPRIEVTVDQTRPPPPSSDSRQVTAIDDDFQFCKALIDTLSPLPHVIRRKLKVQILHIITETVNNYEGGGR